MLREETREKRRVLKVYTIVEKQGAKDYWLEIGVAGVNRDGSISAKLDAFPANGQVHIREIEHRNQEDRRTDESPSRTWRQKGQMR